MDHLEQFRPRKVMPLPTASKGGWRLKRYAILAQGRDFDDAIATAATAEALRRLPNAGTLEDSVKNHGVGFQIIHFAQVAVVSPVFYWQWGSVLGMIDQIRASWDSPTHFSDGVAKVLGCVWEMDVVSYEINAWKTTLLSGDAAIDERLAAYLDQRLST